MISSLDNALIIENARISLLPLTADQLLLYQNLDISLEKQLGLLPTRRSLTDEVLYMITNSVIPYVLRNPAFILYGTLWIIIHKSDKVIIGDIGFKGGPTENGLIEVGYSIYPPYMNMGYMTEALQIISHWAFQQKKVRIIIAETEKKNLASQKVLKNNNFIAFVETDTAYWWRLDKIVLDS